MSVPCKSELITVHFYYLYKNNTNMIIDCLSKAIFLFVIYNIIALILFGVPKSLSMTYYLYKERRNALKILFPSMIVLLCIFLIPCWLTLSEGSNFQFLSFLAPASLMFVGFTPAFNDDDMYKMIHNIAAYSCAAFALLWIILVTPFWYIILIVFGLIAAIAVITKTWKTSYTYWLEMVTIISTFTSIIAYYITK